VKIKKLNIECFHPKKYLHKKRNLCPYRQRFFKFIGIGGILY